MKNGSLAIWGRGAAAVFVVLVAVVPGSAIAASATGAAETSNTIVSVAVGGSAASVGADLASSTRGASSRSARATFTAGQAASSTIGTLDRAGTEEGDSGADEASEGVLTIDDLVSLTVVEAAAAVDLTASRTGSTADAILASIDVLDGLVSVEGLSSSTASEVTGIHAEATRTMSLDGLQVFDLAGLVEAMGTTVTAVPCAGLEAVGAALGISASQTCEQLAAADDALAGARADLATVAAALDALRGGHQEATVAADRTTAAAQTCGSLDALCIAEALTTLTTLAATYGVVPSNSTDLATTRVEVVAALDELLAAFDDEDVIDAAIAEAADGTCAATESALADAEAALSAGDPAGAAALLSAARTEATAACAALQATMDAISATPVVRLDDVVITLTVRAAEGASVAEVAVSIGAVTIGVNDAVAVADIEDGLAMADALVADIAAVIESLMIDAPAPDLELFVVTTSEEEGEGGLRSAAASLSILRFTQPAGTISVPDDAPFAILGGGEPAGVHAAAMRGMLGASPSALLAASVPSPSVVANVITFEASASYGPAAAGGPGPGGGGPGSSSPGVVSGTDPSGTHPVTGVEDWSMLALLFIIGAGAFRRVLEVR